MKITKEAHALARQLLRLSLADGTLDRARVSSLVQSVLQEKPRHYLGALEAYQRLLRLEIEKRHAVIESAAPLNSATADAVVSSLRQKYGNDLTTEFKVNSELIGGMRVKIGSDVWDGSVRNRLARLQEQL
ncbi:MAG: F0F1 ATP synthase subunit delta [Verrucomicrobia bacterium]|nr:F0F1 ATP synthase subunit delta [Verrucomicrobiota bacterium]MBV9658159.1 F0F1 ATP synthase subunit delta [Verrucomicrobiota bacterium]